MIPADRKFQFIQTFKGFKQHASTLKHLQHLKPELNAGILISIEFEALTSNKNLSHKGTRAINTDKKRRSRSF